MSSSQQLAEQQAETTTPDASLANGRLIRYLLWMLLIPGILWIAAFPLVCSHSYENWGETEWGPVLEYPYLAGTPNADVVIWGDSSAFIGVDPHLVNAALGLHSVVLPSTVGSLPVLGDAPLRYFLAHHTQPKIIVLYFSAWNLNFAHMAPGRHFEGEEMMLRHSSLREILSYGLSHPVEFVAFPIRLYSTFGSHMLMEALHGKSREQETLASLGHAPFNEPYPPLNDLCRFPASFLQNYGSDTLQTLQQRFQIPGTRVLVYIAPIPDCTNSGALHNRSYAPLAAPPALLPPTDFAGDPHYAHILPEFVPVSSRLFAAALARDAHLPRPAAAE